MGVTNVIAAAVPNPWKYASNGKGKESDYDPDAGASTSTAVHIQPSIDLSPRQSFGPAMIPPPRSYGATGSSESVRVSPERSRETLDRVPEEQAVADEYDVGHGGEEWDVDVDLEERGLYRGSYKRLRLLYSFVPLTSLAAFIILAAVPFFVFPLPSSTHPQYPEPYFPFPLPELLTSIAFYSLSHLLRIPLYSLSDIIADLLHLPSSSFAALLSTFLHVTAQELLRLASFPVLRLRHDTAYPLPSSEDPTFYRVWALALGWAAVEVAMGIAQGFDQLALYRDVLVDVPGSDEEDRYFPLVPEYTSPLTIRAPGAGVLPQPTNDNLGEGTAVRGNELRKAVEPSSLESSAMLDVERDINQLIALKAREELEEVYGLPFIKIPVFVSCLQRIDSIILSLGLTLVLSSAYLRALVPSTLGRPAPHTNVFPTFIILTLVHLSLSILHTPPVLPRIGVHSAAYVSLLVALGTFFAGLALWGALS